MINRRNAYFHEYIGSEAKVISSGNALNIGISGIVADESKKTLTIKTGNSFKMIPKSSSELLVSRDGSSFVVKGNYIGLRPEDRLKEHRKIEKMIKNGEKHD